MDNLFVLRGKMQEMYARHSRIFDKAIQFIVTLVAFFLINNNIGYMKMLAQPTITLALAVICTFFPMIITVIAAAALILCHMYAASMGMLVVTGIVFFVMFVFYLRLTPKKAFVVLLTPIAFMLKVPYVIPIAYALISGPMTLIAIVCGTIVFYMMQYVKKATPALQGEDVATSMMTQVSAYAKQVFQNKQMLVVIIAFIICFLAVYTIRRQALDHAWKIAIAVGAVLNVVIIAGGNIAMGTSTEYGSLIIGCLLSVVIGLVLEFFFFTVDYAKSENLQFEDDEYYYYVKAVPKLAAPMKEKTVKRINERQEVEADEVDEDEMYADEVELDDVEDFEIDFDMEDDVDQALLAQSLRKDLGMEE